MVCVGKVHVHVTMGKHGKDVVRSNRVMGDVVDGVRRAVPTVTCGQARRPTVFNPDKKQLEAWRTSASGAVREPRWDAWSDYRDLRVDGVGVRVLVARLAWPVPDFRENVQGKNAASPPLLFLSSPF